MEKACKQTKCQYYHNGRGCLNCLHNPDTHVYKLQKQIERLQTENERLAKRDCNADIQLCFDDGNNPFAREDLKVVDVGVSDNCYIVESQTVKDLQAENKRLEKELAYLRNEIRKL